MRILFVNHTGAWSGAEFALMRLVAGGARRAPGGVACPSGGPLAERRGPGRRRALSVPAFEASLRLHPVQTPVGLGRLRRRALAWRASRVRADVIHANTPRAGLMAALARRLGGPPLVVRAHEHLPPSAIGRRVRARAGRTAERDRGHRLGVHRAQLQRGPRPAPWPRASTTASTSSASTRPRSRRSTCARSSASRRMPPLLGQVAADHPLEGPGHLDPRARRAAREGIDAHLLLVGEIAFAGKAVRYDNHGYLQRLQRLGRRARAGRRVHFLGQREDVPDDPARRSTCRCCRRGTSRSANVMLESMAMGTPPLVSDVGGGPELVEDGVSGRLLPPSAPRPGRRRRASCSSDRGGARRMGERARAATGDSARKPIPVPCSRCMSSSSSRRAARWCAALPRPSRGRSHAPLRAGHACGGGLRPGSGPLSASAQGAGSAEQ